MIGPVEAEILAELGQLALADVAGLAHQRHQRVAGHDAHQAKDDQRGEQKDRKREEEPSDHILVHGADAPAYPVSVPRIMPLLVDP